jgi:hypothetical protein
LRRPARRPTISGCQKLDVLLPFTVKTGPRTAVTDVHPADRTIPYVRFRQLRAFLTRTRSSRSLTR